MNGTLAKIGEWRTQLNRARFNPESVGISYTTPARQIQHELLLQAMEGLLDDVQAYNEILEMASNDSLASDGLEMIHAAMRESE